MASMGVNGKCQVTKVCIHLSTVFNCKLARYPCKGFRIGLSKLLARDVILTKHYSAFLTDLVLCYPEGYVASDAVISSLLLCVSTDHCVARSPFGS